MRSAQAFLLGFLLLGGCLGLGSGREDGAPAPAEVPPGCDATRQAVAHRAGGVPLGADDVAIPLPIPCLVRTGHLSGEPTLGFTSDGTLFFGPALESIQGRPVYGGVSPGVARSHDQGASWQRLVPDLAGQPAARTTVDPFLHVDTDTDRVFFDNLLPTTNCSTLSWSDDGGDTWDHSLAGCFEFDHQTLFTGPPVTSTTLGYPNVVYRCALNGGIASPSATMATCQRSLDGGLTWLPPGTPAFYPDPQRPGSGDVPGLCVGAVGHGHVDAQGRVYVPKGWCGQPWLAMSDDEGLTWTRVQVADNGMIRAPGGGEGHDAGVGTDEDGNLYYGWVARDRLPYVAVSRDGGATWSAPRMAGPPGLKESTHPVLAVGTVGRIAFAYVGSLDSPGAPFEEGTDCLEDPTNCGTPPGLPPTPPGYENVTWSGFLTVSVDALADDPTFYSAATNDPADPLIRGYCAGQGCQELYDFIDIAIAPDGTPWASFVDACTGPCASGDVMEHNDAEGVVGRLWGGPSLLGP